VCESAGVIEFINNKLIFVEDEHEIIAYLRRSYGTVGRVTVDFRYNVNYPELVER
jgi:hypothetical protein